MMKKLVLLSLVLFGIVEANAQIKNPVNWTFSSKQIGDNKYEVRLTATIESGWHLYSQNLPEDAIAIPTSVTIANNPLVLKDGNVKEEGKMIDALDKATQTKSRFYADKVEFVQIIKLKTKVKTTVSGNVEYMVCDDKQCLPPKKVPFAIKVG